MKSPHILRYPAPSREPVRTETGWASQPWTVAGILSTISAGGWFMQGRHQFDPGAANFAMDARQVYTMLLEGEGK